MDKSEGVAFSPVSLFRPEAREAARGGRSPMAVAELLCEMCGSAVFAAHCKRICLKCGFMTGCSEGV